MWRLPQTQFTLGVDVDVGRSLGMRGRDYGRRIVAGDFDPLKTSVLTRLKFSKIEVFGSL